MNRAILLLCFCFISACANHAEISKEQKRIINHCAQKKFQCESRCSQTNTQQSAAHQVCLSSCIEQHNQCQIRN